MVTTEASTEASTAARTEATTPVTRQDLIDLVVTEARLIDDGRFEDWNALYADDGLYWIPLTPDRADPVGEASLMLEDKLLRELRIARLRNPRAHSLQAPVRCHHLLQQPTVERFDPEANCYELRTEFHYTERQREEVQFHVGKALHRLRVEDGELKIALKRVDLLDADTALPMIQLFI